MRGLRDIHDVVGVVLVAKNVLSAQQHLERRVRARLLDEPQTLPRIFAQEPHAHVERRAAPAFERVVPGRVDRGRDGEDVVGAHARRPEGLVRVA